MNLITTLTDDQPPPAIIARPRFDYLSEESANTSSIDVSTLNELPPQNAPSEGAFSKHVILRKKASYRGQGAGHYFIAYDLAEEASLGALKFWTLNIANSIFDHLKNFDTTLTVLDQPRYDFFAIVQHLRSDSGLPYRNTLASRIEELLEDWDEVPRVGAASLRTLIQFLEERPSWKAPRVYATDSGMFGAEWENGSNRLSVYAPTNGRARFALTRDDGTQLGGTVRWSQLSTALTSDGASDWLER